MSEMTQTARWAELELTYNGKNISESIADSLLDFTYNDAASGSLDDIDLRLEDRKLKWQNAWAAQEGDVIKATIRTHHWNKPGESQKLAFGEFEVDSGSVGGPPDTVSIKATSLPVKAGVRFEKRTKAWEKTKLKTIAAEVAAKAKLKLLYEATDNPSYDRIDQTEMSDLAFLLDTATKEGIAIKVASGRLVLFDEFEYEKKSPVATIVRGRDPVLDFSFNWSIASKAYRSSVLTYTDTSSKKTYKAAFTPPGAPVSGPVLKLNEQVTSQAEAQRLARIRLREKNKEYGTGSLTLMGDVRMATGLTITLKGWGRYDGKYLIESCSHTLGSGGYTTALQIRKVLGW
ncbi:phage late control D family protein [Paenibacillus glufosinatiresistens]|uniref:phage late control D family protein n=1 Tax=Paenibacillus glufosinatiresistens TaxID=3070657 RepID=UPI00286E92F5|nr:contractile injection system protein, VgrG/Pvc8 family [Paenibacillus sp. YX.27]